MCVSLELLGLDIDAYDLGRKIRISGPVINLCCAREQTINKQKPYKAGIIHIQVYKSVQSALDSVYGSLELRNFLFLKKTA